MDPSFVVAKLMCSSPIITSSSCRPVLSGSGHLLSSSWKISASFMIRFNSSMTTLEQNTSFRIMVSFLYWLLFAYLSCKRTQALIRLQEYQDRPMAQC